MLAPFLVFHLKNSHVFGQDMNLLNEVDQLLTISGAAWAASIYLYASKKEFSEEALLGTSTFGNLQSLTLEAFEFCVFFCHDFLQNRFFFTQKVNPRHSFWLVCWVWRSSFFFEKSPPRWSENNPSMFVCNFWGPGADPPEKKQQNRGVDLVFLNHPVLFFANFWKSGPLRWWRWYESTVAMGWEFLRLCCPPRKLTAGDPNWWFGKGGFL